MSDWLFDGRGPADPQEASLADALRGYRHDRPRRPTPTAWAALTTLVVGVGVGIGWLGRGPAPWSVETASCSGCTWEAGTSLDTTVGASARLGRRGELRARAGAAVRREAGHGARLALDRGTVEVLVDAPAGWLTIDLPGVELVDLGCAFRASVDDQGNGIVQVATGAVALRGTGPETVLPAGTLAATWPDGHTGLAVAEGASEAFVALVDAYDRGGDLAPLLAQATLDDAITLWHLLDRAPDRAVVVDRLEALLGPRALDRDGLLADDEAAEEAALAYVIGRTL